MKSVSNISQRSAINLRTLILSGVALSCFGGLAFAQDETDQDEDKARLPTVVVTAERSEGNLQSVPIAVSAFSAETVEAAGFVNIDDIFTLTPGFTVSSYNPVSPQPYIRGVGTNASSVGDDASVGIFVDDVYSGRAGGFRSTMYDIERIEILRGPQGTLYGRNVAGGAINVATRNPEEDFGGYLNATLGEFNLVDVRGALNVPLGDKVAGRVAVTYRERDGFVDNVITGNEVRSEEGFNIRGKIAAELGENVDVLLSADFSSDEGVGPAARGSAGTDLPTDGDPLNVSLFQDGFSDREIKGVSAKTTIDTSFGEIVSISAFREQEYSFADDLIGSFGTTPTGLVVLGGLGLVNEAEEASEQLTQEVRLSSEIGNNVEYTIGGYIFVEDITRFETFDSSPITFPGLSRPVFDSANETESYAIFGEASIDVSEQLSVTVGGRQTWDEKTFSLIAANPDFFGFLAEPINVQTSEDFSNFSPRLVVNYQATEDVFLYGSWSLGYKAGGFNGLAATTASALVPFEEERAENFEAGVKSEFFDNRLRVNIAAFQLDYDDLQNFLIDTAGGVTVANADAESRGVEVEVFAVPVSGLTLSTTYSYLDTEVKTFDGNPANVGNTLPRSPKHSVGVSAEYRRDVQNLGEFMARADYSYQSRSFLDVENTAASAIPQYDLLNLKLGLELNNGVEVSVFGRNVTDEEYQVHAFDLGPFGFPIFGEPSTWGVTLGYSF